ncbi:male-specific lethal 1-like 1 [Ptychodera flava]|uniref:male-specific lethal 1-like 1 n=1 Tax=Ptychodera flava TaxID=63121 RepID=UPI00396A1165
MKSEIIGPQRMKIEGRPLLHRKNMSRNSAVFGEMPSNVSNHHSNHGDNNTTNKSFAQDVSNSKDRCTPSIVSRSLSDRDLQDEEDRTRLESQVKHLKELLLLHLDVIQEQQRQLLAKDREAKTLRSERDTLKCRLERMERRMSLAQKSGHKSQETEAPQTKSTTLQTNKRRAAEESTTLGSKRFHTTSQKLSNSAKSSTKSEKQISLLQKDKEKGKEKEEKLFRTNVHYVSQNRVPPVLSDVACCEEPVLLPEWRLNIVTSVSSSEGTEDLDDEVFTKRHQKYEIDERKRKRWDIQRIRELRQHEMLERKLLKKDQQTDLLTTFRPNTYDVESVEVHEMLPVTVFNQPLPSMQQIDFELPWFDVKTREKEDNKQRQSRRYGNKK